MLVQNLPGPIVEHRLDPFDLGTRHLSKPCTLWKELAQQPVGVLVGARHYLTTTLKKEWGVTAEEESDATGMLWR